MNVFTLSVRLACDSQRYERLLGIRYGFTSNYIPFRFGCWPREASRLEAKTHEAEAKTHEAEAEAEATTHETEAEAEARFFGLKAEARPRGLTSLIQTSVHQSGDLENYPLSHWQPLASLGTEQVASSIHGSVGYISHVH